MLSESQSRILLQPEKTFRIPQPHKSVNMFLTEFLVFFGSFLYLLKVLQKYLLNSAHFSKVPPRGPQKPLCLSLPPGPRGLPFFGYLPFMTSKPPEKINALAQTYGPMITLYFGSQRVIFINDIQLMKEISRLDVFMGRNQLEIIRPVRENCGLIFLEGQGWTEWRRFVLKTLRDMGFGKVQMFRMIEAQAQDFCDYLAAREGGAVSPKSAMEIASLNALWQILAGQTYDLDDPEHQKVLDIVSEGVTGQEMMGLVVFMPKLAKLVPEFSGYNKAVEVLGAPLKLCQQTVQRHLEDHIPGQERDFIDVALSKIRGTTDPCSSFFGETGMKNLEFTMLDLLFTGFDTVSITTCWAYLLMAMHPEKQRKVREEIDEVLGAYSRPVVQDRPRMVYTEATIMEVLRKATLAQLGVMHTALEDVEFHGYLIPKRTVIMFNLYGVHHDAKLWERPEEFMPERFIGAGGELQTSENLIPFFTGKRSCPGETLARNQLFVFLASVLQKFEIRLAEEGKEIYTGPTASFGLMPPKDKLVFVPRGGVK